MTDISNACKDTQPVAPELVVSDNDGTKTISKRAMRKEKRRMEWQERKLKKKHKRQEQQQAKKANGLVAVPKELDMSEKAVMRRKERTIAKRETYLMAAEEGVKVVIDCEFEEKMTEKEKKSLSQQIMCVLLIDTRTSVELSNDCTEW